MCHIRSTVGLWGGYIVVKAVHLLEPHHLLQHLRNVLGSGYEAPTANSHSYLTEGFLKRVQSTKLTARFDHASNGKPGFLDIGPRV